MSDTDGSQSPNSTNDNPRSATPPLTSVTTNTGCPLKKAIVSEGGKDKKIRIVNLEGDDGQLLYNKGQGGNNVDNLC